MTRNQRLFHCALSVSALASLLFLDGQLGPVSLTLRRAFAVIGLAFIAGLDMGGSGGRRVALLAAVLVVLAAVVLGVPSLQIAVLGFAMAFAASEIAAGSSSSDRGSVATLVPACLAYIAVRFVVDLVPQVGRIAEAIAQAGSGYISRVRGFDLPLSFTALGGPAVGLAALHLLWSVRRAGGVGRVVVAVGIPLSWFALLPVVASRASAGPVPAFSRGAYYGLFWLGVAVVANAFLPVGAALSLSAASLWKGITRRRGDEESDSVPVVAEVVAASAESASAAGRSSRLPLVAAGLAAALAGVCLVGTSFIGPAAGRSIRVFNNGGLDWDRPVFGQFGAFSGGMFGSWPVYCRAEGYDFNVIDKAPKPDEAEEPGAVQKAPEKEAVESAKGAEAPPATASKKGAGTALAAKKTNADNKDSPLSGGGAANGGSAASTASPKAETPKAAAPAKPAPRPETIEPADLANTQILVLINTPKVWDDRERKVVLDFVARGGSLLVLGDHTDVFGLMRGFNSLLAPLGIRFRFDSAYKARESWRGCQVAAPDAVAWGWDEENPGVAVGASLELSGWARPLLVGRYAFSDHGVRENVMGSYLGNYHYDAGERLGDVVLVATATYGRGRVVVWGDTSAFQGVSTYYPTVVGPMLAWLSRPASWTEQPAVRIVAALGLLGAIVWLWIVGGGPRETSVIAGGLLIGMVVPWCLGLPHREARVTIADDVVLFDRSHMPATGHYTAKVNPVGPLYTNLLRSGFRVASMEDWDREAIRKARGIAFVAPQRPFTASEVKELMDAEERGLTVILTVGQPDSAGSRPLIEAHGLALEPKPLGTVTPADPTANRREREAQPRFLDAWPIVALDGGNPVELPGVENVYRHGRDAVALFRRVGKGGLLLIADTRFFSDMNVEDMSGYWVGNLALIHELFQRYLGAEPDDVKPLFRSPVKPQ